MPRSRRDFLAVQATLLAASSAWPGLLRAVTGPSTPSTTDWDLEPAFGFDALCFLNTLTGDPFYLAYYGSEFEYFGPRLTPATRGALAWIKQQINDQGGEVMSAFLCRLFSPGNVASLDDLLATLDNLSAIESALKVTPFYNSDDWRLFLKLTPELRVVLRDLQDVAFEIYWRGNVLPIVEGRIREYRRGLGRYDVVAEDAAMLGHALPSNRVTACFAYFNKPAAIRVAGQRFICCALWDPRVIVNTAAHELLHPPYDLAHDPELRSAIDAFRDDSFLMNKVEHHNPSVGYNSLDALVEEDCVRALDQLVMERLHLAEKPQRRWEEEDDGLHVFAAVLHGTMKETGYPVPGEPFRDYLLRMCRTGAIAPGRIGALYRRFMR